MNTLGRPTLPGAIVDQIRQQILAGELEPGEELPSERDLASGFGVNRTTVREALMELTRLGLIDRKQGRRCTVLDWRVTGSIELLVHMLRLPPGTPLRDEAAASLFDALHLAYRTSLDAIVTGQRSLAPLEADADQLEAAIEAEDEEAVLAADRAFHVTLFQETRSIVFQLLFLTLYRAIDDGLDLGGSYGRRSAAEYVRRRSVGPRLPHRAILTALAARDLETAHAIVGRVVNVMRELYARQH